MRVEHSSCFAYRHEIDALLFEHWHEVAKNKALMVLAPDWERYKAIEDAGKLFTLYAFDGPELIGYSCNIIDNHMHYKGLTIASNDVLFIHPAARGTTGLKLMAATEARAKKLGAQLMLWHAKQDSSLAKVLDHKVERGRASVQDIIYSLPL